MHFESMTKVGSRVLGKACTFYGGVVAFEGKGGGASCGSKCGEDMLESIANASYRFTNVFGNCWID